MRTDYHMHFEKGSYDLDWVEGFFAAAKKRGITEIGISEHSHTFPEFYDLYAEDLVLDDSPVGRFQKKWLKSNKFKYTIGAYFKFMRELQKSHPVKIGIEVCNFKDQKAVGDILNAYPFDYIIGSVHFLKGWGYDASAIKDEWQRHSLREIYEEYTREVEALAASGHYDILGHPFNIRLFRFLPDFDVTEYLERVAQAMKKADMVVDINTGTRYRYPIEEISPYGDFMKVAREAGLQVITSSDAHRPEDCGRYNEEAVAYAKSYGWTESVLFSGRDRKMVPFD